MEENPPGVDPDTEDVNPERQGPGGPTGDEPTEEGGEGPAPPPPEEPAPPPESIPGDSGEVPNPQQN